MSNLYLSCKIRASEGMLQLENKLLSIDKPTALPSLLTITATLDFDLSP